MSMYQTQYAVLGYLGYKICSLARLPDADQSDHPVVNKEEPIQPSGSIGTGGAPSTSQESVTGIVEAVSSAPVSKTVIENEKQAKKESEEKIRAEADEMDEFRTCWSVKSECPSITVRVPTIRTEIGGGCEKMGKVVRFEEVEAVNAPDVESIHPVMADRSTAKREEICCPMEQARQLLEDASFPIPDKFRASAGHVNRQETPQEQPPMAGDASTIDGKPAYQYGLKFERTHRQQVPTTDELWAPWRRSQVRRPKVTKHPFLAYKNAMWWQVRAEMPHLNTRMEIMEEVRRRWYHMPEDAKQLFKDSVRVRATRLRSATGQYLSTAEDRIRRAEQRLNMILGQGTSGTSNGGSGTIRDE